MTENSPPPAPLDGLIATTDETKRKCFKAEGYRILAITEDQHDESLVTLLRRWRSWMAETLPS